MAISRPTRVRRVVRWVAGGAVLAGLGAGLSYVGLVFQQRSSTAAIGLLATPFVAVFAGALGAALGWALYELRYGRPWRERRLLPWVRWGAATALLAVSAGAIGPQAARWVAFRKLQQEGIGPPDLQVAARNALRTRDWFVLSAVARNPGASPELLLEIAGNDDPGLHEKRQGWIQLLDRDSLAVSRKLLRNPNLPPEAILLLARSTNAYVLGDLAGHADTPEPMLREIYARSPGYLVHWGLTRNPRTPPEILQEIAEQSELPSNWIVASHLAGNPATPVPILEELATHEHFTVGCALAGNPSITPNMMEALSSSPDRRVRVRLTQNEALSFDLAERLWGEDPEGYVRDYAERALGRIAASARTPRETLRRMATHQDWRVRRQAAANAPLDSELAERLAADPESKVRYYLAFNEHLDLDVLELLARDPSRSVAAEAARRLAERAGETEEPPEWPSTDAPS